MDDEDGARTALSISLPHWTDPWLLKDDTGDVIAFLSVERDKDDGISIQADVSGRHYDASEKVVGLLRHLQTTLGGQITDDDENIL